MKCWTYTFQLSLKTRKSLGWSNRFRHTVPYCRTGNRYLSYL